MIRFAEKFSRLSIVLALIALLVASYPLVLGATLEGYLGGLLSRMFGMKVEIRGLEAEVFSGHVKARRIIFWNQPGFSSQPHFDVRDFEFWICFRDLLDKKVRVDTLYLRHPVYRIERILAASGTKNNVSTWVDHILKWEASIDDDPLTPTKWTVGINEIIVSDGRVIVEETDLKNQKMSLVFGKLKGSYDDFFWRPPDQDALSETVHLHGVVGEKNPAPFAIKGKSNFAAREISFDLRGSIPDGDMTEFSKLWEGLPLKIVGGRFKLNTHVICKHEHLESRNLLVMNNLKLYPEMSVSGTLWGIPLMAGSAFLQQEKSIELKISVNGDIANPKFRFGAAFRDAFQSTLAHYTKTGVKLLTSLPMEVARKTQAFAEMAPAGFVGGVEKLSSMVVEGASQVKSKLLNQDRQSSKTDGGS